MPRCCSPELFCAEALNRFCNAEALCVGCIVGMLYSSCHMAMLGGAGGHSGRLASLMFSNEMIQSTVLRFMLKGTAASSTEYVRCVSLNLHPHALPS